MNKCWSVACFGVFALSLLVSEVRASLKKKLGMVAYHDMAVQRERERYGSRKLLEV